MAASLYAAVAPHFTQDLRTPELKIAFHDEGGSWPFVAASLALRLPLRGIEWRNLVGATKRIERLPLTFVPQAHPSQPQSQQQQPLVALYLVKCEDLEHYRSGAKARLAAWVERMNAARVEWMVLYVPLGTRARAGGGGANHSAYKKIFDKIRADFAHKRPSFSGGSSSSGGAGGAGLGGSSIGGGSSGGNSPGTPGGALTGAGERICKIEILEGNSVIGGAPGQQQQHEAQWSELLLRLRHCIMDAFQVKCYQYEEEVRVLDAKRNANTAGWDSGAFFLAKERLALMYQQTYLLDDAIRHFDELDAIFANLSDSGNRAARGETDKYSIRASDPIFTTAPLAVDLSATQLVIAANRASPLVIQLHCFCRQIRALYLMGNFPQLIERATAFISAFFLGLKQLYETTSAIEAHQPFQWAIGACVEIAYACELSWNGHDYQVSSASVPAQVTEAIVPEVMSRHLGDILYLARRILVRFSRLVSEAPHRLSLSEEARDQRTSPHDDLGIDTENPSAWYQWLQQVFASRSASERLERCVWEMSHLASLHFSRAGRHRFAVFLGAECARYHFRHREFESASRLFRSHSRQCEEDKWRDLVDDCVRHICKAEAELGRAPEAVAECLSVLDTAQETHAETEREHLEKSWCENTVQISVAGPPLLAPQSVEQICVTIRSQNDEVANGVLEIECVGESEELGLVQFLKAELQTPSPGVSSAKRSLEAMESDLKDKLLLSIPSMTPGETRVYQVWLWVGDVDERESEGEGVLESTVSATLRYQQPSTTETLAVVRRAYASFQLLQPLEERVRIKRMQSKVVAAITLTCNSEYAIVIRDYRLEPGVSSIRDDNSSQQLTVLHDPNARLRNSRLQPGETIHLAFTLSDGCEDASRGDSRVSRAHCAAHLPDEAHLMLDLQYDSAACGWVGEVEDGESDASQPQSPRVQTPWEDSLLVRLPLATAHGTRYRVEVEPKAASRAAADASRLEFAVGEEVAFHVVVHALCENESSAIKIEERDVLLCLDESSERDWILLGKQRERFQLHEQQQELDASEKRGVRGAALCFSTLKRLVTTRVGHVRFPSFHLRDAEGQRTPVERVALPHRAMQVIVR